jgi:hypothetical protein
MFPAASIAMPIGSIGSGATDPHVAQKRRVPPSGDGYSATLSSPLIHSKAVSGAPSQVAKGAPWCLRQREQWQCAMKLNGALIEYFSVPQRQVPCATVDSLKCVR